MNKIESHYLHSRGRLYFDWILVTLLFIIFLSVSIIWNVKDYYYDSSYYWNIANSMIGANGFSMMAFPDTFRGYFYPFVLLMLKGVSTILFHKENTLFIVVNSASVAILVGKVIPIHLGVKISSKRQIIGSVIFAAFICIFWKDAITYPLSDLPAMVMFMIALAFMRVAEKTEISEIDKIKSNLKYLLYGFFIGAFLYASYNTRAIYLIAILLSILFFLYKSRKKHKRDIIALSIAAIFGASIIALPQAIINEKYSGKFTPRIMTEQSRNVDLQIAQLNWGISVDRYESYIGSKDVYDISGGIRFSDKAGDKILQQENISLDTFNIVTLLKLYLKYPLDFAGIYTRHIISYITNISNDAYVKEFYQNTSIKFVLNAIIWFIGVLGLLIADKDKRCAWFKRNGAYLLCILLPCIIIIPGAPEIRFFLPAYFILYGYLCFQVDISNVKSIIIRKPIIVAGSFLAALLIWTASIGSILASVDDATLLIKNKIWTMADKYVFEETVASADRIVMDKTEDVNTWNTPITILANQYYYIEFETNAIATDVKLFYVDLYAGPEYDKAEQDLFFSLDRKDNKYSGVLYTGKEVLVDSALFRLVTIPHKAVDIRNLIIKKCEIKK